MVSGGTSASEAGPTAPGLACMEVWGGSDAFEGSITVPGHCVQVCCAPHEGGARGGDLYYVSNCAAGLITRFVLADISGHGEEVAGAAAMLRRLMRRYINTADQSRFARSLNRTFTRLADARFATAVLLTYFAPTDHLIVCNTGHPRPLFYRASEDRWALLDDQTPRAISAGDPQTVGVGIANLPLGILHPMGFRQFAVPLEPGDLVILYTDALIEADSGEGGGGQLGEAGLLRLVSGFTAAQRADPAASLRSAVATTAARTSLNDDATIVALCHDGSDPPTLTWRERAGVLARMLGLGLSH